MDVIDGALRLLAPVLERIPDVCAHTDGAVQEYCNQAKEFATETYPWTTATFVILSLLTSPIAMVKLMPILFVQWPFHILVTAVGYVWPSLLEKDLGNDIVVVTGAGSGIGRLMAKQFSELGASVVMIDKNEAALASVEAEPWAKVRSRRLHAVAADLSDREETYEAMRRAEAAAGGPCTILVNNAGIVTGKTLLESPDELMELSMRVNAHAHFWTIKAALPKMIEANRGHIVTIASSAGEADCRLEPSWRLR